MRELGWRAVPGGVAIAAAGIATSVLIGWAIDSPFLKQVHPSGRLMVPNTAVALLLLGIGLGLATVPGGPLARRLSRIAALVVVVVAGSTMVEYVSGLDLGIDGFLLPHSSMPDSYPGRPAPSTAVTLLLLGAGVLLVDVETRARRPAEYLALAAALPALLALLGYAYAVPSLYAVSPFGGMALHTGLALLALSVGLFFARPRAGLAGVVLSQTAGGLMARRLFLPMLLVPVAAGGLRLVGARAGLYGSELGMALVVVVTVALVGALLLANARLLYRLDLERQGAVAAVIESERRLRDYFEHSPAGMYRTAADGRILACNAACARILGYDSAEEVRERNVIELYAEPVERDRLISGLRLVGAVSNLELRLLRKDGRQIWVLVNVIAVTGATGLEFEGQIVDVTEKRAAETALRAQEALAAVQALATAAAHEINNPLTPIVGGLHILRDRVRGDRLAEQLVDAAMKSATRIHDIVRDMGRITGLPLLEWAPPGVPMLDLKRSAPETPLASDSEADRRGDRSDGPPAGVS